MQKLFLYITALSAALLISCSGTQRPLTPAETAHVAVNTAAHALALFDTAATLRFNQLAEVDPRHAIAVFAPVVRAEEASLMTLHDAENMIATAERLGITPDRCRLAELSHVAAQSMQALLTIAQTVDAFPIPPELVTGIQMLEAIAAAQTCPSDAPISAGAH